MDRRSFFKKLFWVVCGYGGVSFVLNSFSFLFGMGKKKNSIGKGDTIVVVLEVGEEFQTYGGIVENIRYDELCDTIIMDLDVLGGGSIEVPSGELSNIKLSQARKDSMIYENRQHKQAC